MITPAQDIEDWFRQIPEERRRAFSTFRRLIYKYMVDVEEDLRYKMPTYSRNGKAEIAFNSQKNYLSLYIMKHEVMLANAVRLKHVDCGKGCLRFPNPEKIDWELVEQLIKDNAASSSIPC